jgi:hypothetical protein
VLTGVTVTARHVGTNQTRETVTDGQVRYAFPDLAIGTQEITSMLQGFQTARRNIQLTVGQNAGIDITLALGTVTETIEVTASAIGVESGCSRAPCRRAATTATAIT